MGKRKKTHSLKTLEEMRENDFRAQGERRGGVRTTQGRSLDFYLQPLRLGCLSWGPDSSLAPPTTFWIPVTPPFLPLQAWQVVVPTTASPAASSCLVSPSSLSIRVGAARTLPHSVPLGGRCLFRRTGQKTRVMRKVGVHTAGSASSPGPGSGFMGSQPHLSTLLLSVLPESSWGNTAETKRPEKPHTMTMCPSRENMCDSSMEERICVTWGLETVDLWVCWWTGWASAVGQ